MKFISTILENDALASYFTALISALIPIWLFFRGKRTELTRPRYEQLISPLFELAEPYMLRHSHMCELDVAAIHAIMRKNPHLCDGKLRCFLQDDLDDLKSRDRFCNVISKEFDQSCRMLGLSRRSFLYRFDRYHLRFCVFHFVAVISLALFALLSSFFALYSLLNLCFVSDQWFNLIHVFVFLLSILSLIASIRSNGHA